MKKWLLFCCFSVSLGACPTANRAQVAGNGPVEESLLKMEILLRKETYRSTEDISTATSFLNLSDKTLCFPKPAQEQINSVQGFLTTKVIAPVGDGDAEMFIEVVDSRGTWPRDKLVQEIKSKWVKLLTATNTRLSLRSSNRSSTDRENGKSKGPIRRRTGLRSIGK